MATVVTLLVPARQAPLFLGARTELLTGQSWHLVGSDLDEYGVPGSLRFTGDEFGWPQWARRHDDTVQRLSDEDESMDFGHVDTVLGRDAEALVWQPILDWMMGHRENRP